MHLRTSPPRREPCERLAPASARCRRRLVDRATARMELARKKTASSFAHASDALDSATAHDSWPLMAAGGHRRSRVGTPALLLTRRAATVRGRACLPPVAGVRTRRHEFKRAEHLTLKYGRSRQNRATFPFSGQWLMTFSDPTLTVGGRKPGAWGSSRTGAIIPRI